MDDQTKAKRDDCAEEFYKKSGYVPTEWAINNFFAGFDAGYALGLKQAKGLAKALEYVLLYAEDFFPEQHKILEEFKQKENL